MDFNRKRKSSTVEQEKEADGPVRKKAERAKLKGVACPCCLPYYDSLGLSPKSKQDHIQVVSRHRYKVPPPPTPEHYWDVDFPSSAECKRRGYENKTDKPYVFKSRATRRKLRLQERSKDRENKKPDEKPKHTEPKKQEENKKEIEIVTID